MKIKKISGVTNVTIDQNGQEALGEVTSEREVGIAEIQAALADTKYKVYAA